MIHSFWIYEEKNRKILNGAIYAVIGSGAMLAITWTATGIMAANKLHKLSASLATKRQALARARADLSKEVAPSAAVPEAPIYQSITAFRAIVDGAGDAAKCGVVDFSASPTANDFANHFSAAGNGAGYKQMHVDITVAGSLSTVINFAKRLMGSPMPLQYSSFDIGPNTPDPKNPSNGSSVSTKLGLDVLIKTENT